MASNDTANNVNNSDHGHTHLKQQLEKNLKITSANPSKNTVQRKKEKKTMATVKLFVLRANAKKLEWQLQSFLHYAQTQLVKLVNFLICFCAKL